MEVKEGQVYRHFKGHEYIIVRIGYDSETLEVVYESITDKKVWVRKHDNFISKVDHEKYPNVKQEYRFELIHD